jgi:hypothetical protein
MHRRKRAFPNKRHRRFEIILCLAGKPDDEVRRSRRNPENTAAGDNSSVKRVRQIFPLHPGKRRVTAALAATMVI